MKKFTLLLWVLFCPMILLSQNTQTQSNTIISADLNFRPRQDIRELMPENNYCIDAIAIQCGQTINGNTFYATESEIPSPNCTEGSKHDVFYTLNAIKDTEYILNVQGANYDAVIVVYNGFCTELHELHCINEYNYVGANESMRFIAQESEVLYIRTYDWGTSAGEFSFSLHCNEVFDCMDMQANYGDSCDDHNPLTENDTINELCDCTGSIMDETCVPPYDIVLNRISPTSASFEAGNTEWHYQGTANRAGRPIHPYPMYGMEDLAVPHIQHNLSPHIAYDVWFRAICENNTFSEWTGPTYLGLYTSNKINLFPNPTQGIVHINNIEITRIDVLNKNGLLIKSIINPTNNINLTELPSDNYYIKIIDAMGKTYHDKVIKH